MIRMWMVYNNWGEENEIIKFFYYHGTALKFLEEKNQNGKEWNIEEIQVIDT